MPSKDARHRLRHAGLLLGAVALWALARSAGADDRGDTLATLDALKKDVAHRDVLADPILQAETALERAARLRALGDELHARQADGLASEWAETGRDLVRAVEIEDRAAEQRSRALESQGKLARTRALIDEAVAHVGRLRALIDEANRSAPRRAPEAHDHDAEKPAPTPPGHEAP
jgi:hypothetical protein